jgi:homoserine O-succinyltransferase
MGTVLEQDRTAAARCLRIALVNNMGDGALARTERQFVDLLDRSAPELSIVVGLYSCPSLQRGPDGQRHLAQRKYRAVSELFSEPVDAVIVTGAEPRTAELTDETYWAALSTLFNGLDRNHVPAIFSCLAAQAAVLHFDGIKRRPLPQKRFGLYSHVRTVSHELTQSLGANLAVPHSRCNELALSDLVENGYDVLTVSAEAGADLFVRRGSSRSIFFQGHPEYDPGVLGREYLRDVKRYLAGERETYPSLPDHYFRKDDAERLESFRARAMQARDPDIMDGFPYTSCLRAESRATRPPASPVFRTWLQRIADAKFGARTQSLVRRYQGSEKFVAASAGRGAHLRLVSAKG